MISPPLCFILWFFHVIQVQLPVVAFPAALSSLWEPPPTQQLSFTKMCSEAPGK